MAETSGKVLELTDYTFDETIEKNPIILVLFYAPWCVKSKGILPEFDKAAKLIKQIGKPYVLAKVDATSQTQVSDKVGIEVYPVIKLYINKEAKPYDKKEFNADTIIRFIDRAVRPPSVELLVREEIEGLKESKGMKAVLISDDEKIRAEFIEAAKSIKDIPFYHMSIATGKQYFAEVPANSVIFMKGKDEGKFILSENLIKNNIVEFISLNMFPAVTNFNQDVLGQILKPNGRLGIALFRSSSDPNAKKYDEEFTKLATEKKSLKTVFVISDVKGTIEEKVAKYIQLDIEKMPMMVILQKKEDLAKYDYTGELTQAGMGKYLDDFLAGKIVRTLKSEEEPVPNLGPVYKIVGNTFSRDVLNNDLDVFVKFYAPWCGHCKSLAPVYHELAEQLKNNPMLKLAEVDATANEIPGHKVTSFPTLKLFVGGRKENAINYEGPRTIEGMLEFLKKNCKHEIKMVEKTSDNKEIKEEKEAGVAHDDGGQCGVDTCKDKPKDS